MSSGMLCCDWVYGEGENDYLEVGALDYWDIYATVKALKPYTLDCKTKMQYHKAKGDTGKGFDVVKDAYDSALTAHTFFEGILQKMISRYKKEEYLGDQIDNQVR
tara:strand:- start:3105 stop:3419 length:315 start_codon:yes stop_codon:yes gene_type:complete